MKQILLLFIIDLTFSLTVQNEDYGETYSWYVATNKGEILNYKLELSNDGTSQFSSYKQDIGKNEYRYCSNGNVPTTLQFYKSDIFWIANPHEA
jgi:hypothetical protein